MVIFINKTFSNTLLFRHLSHTRTLLMSLILVSHQKFHILAVEKVALRMYQSLNVQYRKYLAHESGKLLEIFYIVAPFKNTTYFWGFS